MTDLNQEEAVVKEVDGLKEVVEKLLTFLKKVPLRYYVLLVPTIFTIQLLYIVTSIINTIPIFSQLVEVVGFYTVVQFLIKRALKQKDREILLEELKEKTAEFF